ncbi:MAG: hypothetical protein RI897_104 [Verrucomicrobiota bacterium]
MGAALDGADTDAVGEADFAERFAEDFESFGDADLLDFDAAACDFLDEEAFGVPDVFGEFDGGEALGTEEVIDVEVISDIEQPFFSLESGVDAGDGALGTESFGEGGGDQVGVIVS